MDLELVLRVRENRLNPFADQRTDRLMKSNLYGFGFNLPLDWSVGDYCETHPEWYWKRFESQSEEGDYKGFGKDLMDKLLARVYQSLDYAEEIEFAMIPMDRLEGDVPRIVLNCIVYPCQVSEDEHGKFYVSLRCPGYFSKVSRNIS